MFPKRNESPLNLSAVHIAMDGALRGHNYVKCAVDTGMPPAPERSAYSAPAGAWTFPTPTTSTANYFDLNRYRKASRNNPRRVSYRGTIGERARFGPMCPSRGFRLSCTQMANSSSIRCFDRPHADIVFVERQSEGIAPGRQSAKGSRYSVLACSINDIRINSYRYIAMYLPDFTGCVFIEE